MFPNCISVFFFNLICLLSSQFYWLDSSLEFHLTLLQFRSMDWYHYYYFILLFYYFFLLSIFFVVRFFTFCSIDSPFHSFLLFFIISEQPYELGIKLPSTYCDRVFEDCSQNNKKKCKIRSPNWPGFYNRNITCKFRIRHHGQVPKGHKIRIVISQVSQTERIKHLEIDDMTKHWHKDIA